MANSEAEYWADVWLTDECVPDRPGGWRENFDDEIWENQAADFDKLYSERVSRIPDDWKAAFDAEINKNKIEEAKQKHTERIHLWMYTAHSDEPNEMIHAVDTVTGLENREDQAWVRDFNVRHARGLQAKRSTSSPKRAVSACGPVTTPTPRQNPLDKIAYLGVKAGAYIQEELPKHDSRGDGVPILVRGPKSVGVRVMPTAEYRIRGFELDYSEIKKDWREYDIFIKRN